MASDDKARPTFGKRNDAVEPEQPHQASKNDLDDAAPAGAVSDDTKFPWDGDASFVACNLATGNLANNLAAWVMHNGRVHAETYVATSGAIAGYAAQQTLRAQHGHAPLAGLHVATTSSGKKFLFGDALNEVLLAKTDTEAPGRVWPRAAGAAVSAGLPMTQIPSLEDMFRHVAGSIGGPMDGRPSTGPEHQPMAPAGQLLALHWPQVERLFKADFDDLHRRFGPVPQTWWCAVAAFATARPIFEVKEVLAPAIALTILMESAIYASKLTAF